MRDPWQLAAERYDNAPMPTASGKRRAAARKKINHKNERYER